MRVKLKVVTSGVAWLEGLSRFMLTPLPAKNSMNCWPVVANITPLGVQVGWVVVIVEDGGEDGVDIAGENVDDEED